MGKHNGSSPLKEINVKMHSISNAPGYTRDDVTDDNSECGMVSEITTITRAVDLGQGPVEPTVRYCTFSWMRPSLIRVFVATCLLVVACLLAVVIVRHRASDDSGPAGGADAGTVATVDSGPGDGKMVEFTVANLNTNAKNCTQVGHELQCVPYHNSATDKFRIRLRPEWAPLGVDRFEYLTASGFWEGVRVFRIVPNFVSQFGISSYPDVQRGWSDVGPISDDPVVASNGRGTVTFATSGPDTRTTQIFINTNDNWYLDDQGFAPIGEVLPAGEGYGGMEVVEEFYSRYGERPEQEKMEEEGEDYLLREFPLLSYFVRAEFVEEDGIFRS